MEPTFDSPHRDHDDARPPGGDRNDGLRIGLSISELQIGGAEKNFVRLACGLQRHGYHVHVYSLDPRPAPDQEDLVDQLQRADIPCRFLKVPKWSWAPWSWAMQLQRVWRQDRIQLNYSFLFRANLAATLASTVLASTVLASRVRDSAARRCSPATPPLILGFRQADPRPLVRWLETQCLRRAHATICVSRQVASHYAKQRPVLAPADLRPDRHGQVVVIPNGITARPSTSTVPADLLNRLTPSSPAAIPPPYLLYVGRLTHQKGVDQLLALAPDFLGALPTHHLVLLGQGDQEAALRDLAARSPVGDRIHFLGWRPNPGDYLAAASLILLHSRWEGLPNVLLEAMSLGKVVVTTRSEGVDEIFALADLARRKQVVPSGSPQDFCRAVVELASDADLAKKLGTWNQIRVQSAFSEAKFLTDHEQVFRKLAGGCQHALLTPSANLTNS